MLHRTHKPLALPPQSPRTSRVLLLISLLFGLLALSSTASAALPTVEQCLEASDRSLELETQEKLLATRESLRICASLGCPQEVRDECARRIELVEQNIPSVICEVRDAAGRVRLDTPITVDQRIPISPSQELIELDPGTHTLTAQAPGERPVTQTVTVKALQKNRRVRILLGGSALRRGIAPRQGAALVAGGVGVTSLVAASVFAVIALDRKQDAQALCPNSTCVSRAGTERWESARQAGNISTGFIVGGVAALGVAAGLWFSFDHHDTTVSLGPERIQLRATF